MKYFLSDHAFERSEQRDISIESINAAVTKGKEYKSKDHGGQLRFYHGGVCVVVRKTTNTILTCYRYDHQ
jgi:hypothetical protein